MGTSKGKTGAYSEPVKHDYQTGQGKTKNGDITGTHQTNILDLPADDMSPEMPRGGRK